MAGCEVQSGAEGAGLVGGRIGHTHLGLFWVFSNFRLGMTALFFRHPLGARTVEPARPNLAITGPHGIQFPPLQTSSCVTMGPALRGQRKGYGADIQAFSANSFDFWLVSLIDRPPCFCAVFNRNEHFRRLRSRLQNHLRWLRWGDGNLEPQNFRGGSVTGHSSRPRIFRCVRRILLTCCLEILSRLDSEQIYQASKFSNRG